MVFVSRPALVLSGEWWTCFNAGAPVLRAGDHLWAQGNASASELKASPVWLVIELTLWCVISYGGYRNVSPFRHTSWETLTEHKDNYKKVHAKLYSSRPSPRLYLSYFGHVFVLGLWMTLPIRSEQKGVTCLPTSSRKGVQPCFSLCLLLFLSDMIPK